MESENNCPICGETFSISRKKVVCFCENYYCRKCFKNYIIAKKQEAQCMFCKKKYTRQFLANNLDVTFLNTIYKKIKEDLLFQREETLFPESQKELEDQMNRYNGWVRFKDKNSHGYIHINVRCPEKIANVYIPAYEDDVLLKRRNSKKKFTIKCPKCQGFLNEAFECSLCLTKVCTFCAEIEQASHICDKEAIKSVHFIRFDTKPCPRCGMPIHKINGCNDMFCTNCYTPFHWETLNIIKGEIFNPEYFVLLQRGDIRKNCCNELNGELLLAVKNNLTFGPKISSIARSVEQLYGVSTEYIAQKQFINIARKLMEMNTELQNNEKFNVIGFGENSNIRKLYLLNLIDRKEFISIILRKEKKVEKIQEFASVLRTFVVCCTDSIFRLKDEPYRFYEFLSEISHLRINTNKILEDLSKTFQCIKYEIDEDFVLHYGNRTKKSKVKKANISPLYYFR